MKPYQRQFIEFALSKQVLKFGEFTLKSGRKSPYFFNAGLFNTGRDLALLGRFYAEALVDSGIEFDLLFGPAYKGIPIATTTAVALAEHHDLDLPYCFNRKEAKDHGEGGNLVGSALQGRVMLVDDVITAGTAIRESMEIIQANGATLAGVLISLDRQDHGRCQSLFKIIHYINILPSLKIRRIQYLAFLQIQRTGSRDPNSQKLTLTGMLLLIIQYYFHQIFQNTINLSRPFIIFNPLHTLHMTVKTSNSNTAAATL